MPIARNSAVTGVLRYRVFSAHRLPRGAVEHRGQCDKADKGTLVDGHGSQFLSVLRLRSPRGALWKLPTHFVPVCLRSYKQ
jgi:hypothetical protein